MLSTASLAHSSSSSSNKSLLHCCATKKKLTVHVTNTAAPSHFTCPYRLVQQTAHRHFGPGLSMRSKPMLVSKAACLLLQNTLCLCPQPYGQSLATRSLSGNQAQSLPQNADDSVSADKAASDRAALDQCLSLIQQGRIIDGLTLLQQLTTAGIFPERQVGDAILLVSTKADPAKAVLHDTTSISASPVMAWPSFKCCECEVTPYQVGAVSSTVFCNRLLSSGYSVMAVK